MKKKRLKKKKELFAYDCETDPFDAGAKIAPFLWGVYDGETYSEFDRTEDFISFVRENPGTYYAHNGGKFDSQFFLGEIDKGQRVMIINGRLAKFKIGNSEFRDSYSIMPVALRSYKKTDIEYWKLRKEHREKYRQEISEYLKDDCVFLWDMVSRFREKYGTGLTLAGCAMKIYRRDFGNGSNLQNFVRNGYAGRGYHDELKPYYFGGRTQAFEKGEIPDKMVYYDINSAYPFAMSRPQPHGYKYSIRDRLNGKAGTSFVSVECDAAGCFPQRDDKGNLEFPHGRGVFHVSDWEFYAAEKCGLLRNAKILKVLEFPGWIRFDEYVKHFYDMKNHARKQESDAEKFDYMISKLFMNSLYGKFATDPRNFSDCRVVDPAEIDTADFTGTIGQGFAVEEKPLEPAAERFFNLATAAAITGFVRAMLLETMAKSERVVYCDTDSLICSRFGGEIGEALGQWKLEAEINRAWIGGKKIYCLDTPHGLKTACKGVRATPEQIKRVCLGETVPITQDAPCIRFGRQTALTRNIKMT